VVGLAPHLPAQVAFVAARRFLQLDGSKANVWELQKVTIEGKEKQRWQIISQV